MVLQPPSRGCVLKLLDWLFTAFCNPQPPSGGCVLKQSVINFNKEYEKRSHLRVAVCWNPFFRPDQNKGSKQPPSGGCVLKQTHNHVRNRHFLQPPSGGCVLKPQGRHVFKSLCKAAASARLCVETPKANILTARLPAATSARLRVETVITIKLPLLIRAAAYLRKDERRQNDYVSKWIT